MSEKNPHLTPQSRNAWGLIQGIDYKTNEDGSINWRAMVKPEHLFPNRGWFESRKQQMTVSHLVQMLTVNTNSSIFHEW
jgi:hypothetical protein